MNHVSLVGNLTKEPAYGTTQSGVTYCRFTVACQRRFKNANGTYDADFIDCVAWRQTADFVHKYFIKGNRIGLTGSIQTGSYTAQDGTKRYTTEVAVENVEFVAPRGDSVQPSGEAPQRNEQQRMNTASREEDMQEIEDDELPF